MASLISSTDRESFQNGYLDFFDTFKEDVHVFKAPKKIFSAITSQGFTVMAINPTLLILRWSLSLGRSLQ